MGNDVETSVSLVLRFFSRGCGDSFVIKLYRAAQNWYSDVHEKIRALISDYRGGCFLFTITLRNEADKIKRLSTSTASHARSTELRFLRVGRTVIVEMLRYEKFAIVFFKPPLCYRWRIAQCNRRGWSQLTIWLISFLFSRRSLEHFFRCAFILKQMIQRVR